MDERAMPKVKRNLPLGAIKKLARRATIMARGYLCSGSWGKTIWLHHSDHQKSKRKMLIPMSHNHYMGKEVWMLIIPCRKVRKPPKEIAPGSTRKPRAIKFIEDFDDSYKSGDLGF